MLSEYGTCSMCLAALACVDRGVILVVCSELRHCRRPSLPTVTIPSHTDQICRGIRLRDLGLSRLHGTDS